jgi:uncharacterized protein YkwD
MKTIFIIISFLVIITSSLALALSQYQEGYHQGVLDTNKVISIKQEINTDEIIINQELDTDLIHELVTMQRLNHNLIPFKHNPLLCDSALKRAKESTLDWSHNGYTEQAKLMFLKYPKITRTGENLSRAYTSETSMVDAWMRSESHKDNIINYDYTDTCIMCYMGNCAQFFATFED